MIVLPLTSDFGLLLTSLSSAIHMKAPYRTLYVWNASIQLAADLVPLIDRLAQNRRFALADQISRASISVPSNIAEGYGRITLRDWRRFLAQSRGSLYEVETQLEIALRMRELTESEAAATHEPIAKIAAGLNNLINGLTRKVDGPMASLNKR